MADKVKITFVLPETLQKDLKEHVVKDGYDLKGKSRWVTEAIASLLAVKSFPDYVKLNDEMQGFGKLESVVVARTLKKQLEDAVIHIRKQYPAIEGVQSRIVRTAIVQRLLGYK
jgi:hypothetical protein